MKFLWVTTLIWSFSFTLIGKYLSGKVDSYYAVAIRFWLALLVLLPFVKLRRELTQLYLKIALVGAVQVGLMYIFFYRSFLYMPVPLVILSTSFTPLYIGLFESWKTRKSSLAQLGAIGLAIFGALIVRWSVPPERWDYWTGFALVQGANLCFGIGQVWYREITASSFPKGHRDIDSFVWFYVGAVLVITPIAILFGNAQKMLLESAQLLTLLWLGVVASGGGYLLWNRGTREVSGHTLAIMNNLVVPLGVIVSLLWGANIQNNLNFYFGSGLIGLSLYLNLRGEKH